MISLLLATALASTPAVVRACLASNDVPCADKAITAMGATTSTNPATLALAAEVAFYGARYAEARALADRATDAGYVDLHDQIGLYTRTADVMEGWAELRSERFVVRYRPGVDAILIDEALATLEAAHTNIAPLLGGPPPGPTVLEIYPDGASFVACSSLPEEAVETTGVVALSKWSRLLAISPRALGRGYAWKDTVAHEYIHLIVSHETDDRTPVWMQEAIARYLDNRWEDGKDHFRLSPRDEGLLGTAVRDGTLLTFDQMHPSLALLPSAEMAALAYAQVSSLMAYSFDRGGEDVLKVALPAIRTGTDPRDALASAAGVASFDVLQRDWLEWLETQSLNQTAVAELPTALDGADEAASDPVMAARADLRRYMRLGDLLREEGRPAAALKEYSKALDPEEPPSPLLANKIARAHLDLGYVDVAKKDLEDSLRFYPEFALSHKTLAQIQEEAGELKSALRSYEHAADLNPFDPAVQEAIARLAKAQGATARAAQAAEDLRILRRGGQEANEVTLISPQEVK